MREAWAWKCRSVAGDLGVGIRPSKSQPRALMSACETTMEREVACGGALDCFTEILPPTKRVSSGNHGGLVTY